MQIAHGSSASDRPLAVTIGNFDGVHRGHQAMVARTVAVARARGLGAAALTFEPHPREVFGAQSAPTRLTALRDKLLRLATLGLDRVHVERFSRRFAAMSPQEFVDRVLVDTLHARWVLVGADFCFGARRAGTVERLRDLAGTRGIDVEVIGDVLQDGQRISSSAIRDALAHGDLARAQNLLGRHFSISGKVVHGQKLGRTLGFPTANIQLKHNRPPLLGIYAVKVHGISVGAASRDAPGTTVHDGVASLGYRPTVSNDRRASLEVFVFDFAGDLYGQHLSIEFVAKLRDEETYKGLPELKIAIARDCEHALRVLRAPLTAGSARSHA